ncbi:trypsin-1-like [Daphnia pulex]|uniref:trypsin-1-like n=1 Tax=Daphnia pulex TaxID=6669 RepID=UPI001EDD1748|nr:trypsin-1-like [Daphnia pulex]
MLLKIHKLEAALISDDVGRISNGFDGSPAVIVPAEKYPFIVSVTLNDVHICGGFIYNSRFIVTAASCVFNKTTAQIQITVGQLSLILPDPGEMRLQVRAIYVHENFDNITKVNDIAMLETSQTIEFNANVNFTYYDTVGGPLAIVSGWGAVDESKVVSSKLREAIVYAPINCDLFPADVYDPNIMFCWGRSEYDNGIRPCQYDEGSPLFKPTTILVMGIVSKNLGCGDSEIYETIYTRLVVYYYWMLKTGGPQP